MTDIEMIEQVARERGRHIEIFTGLMIVHVPIGKEVHVMHHPRPDAGRMDRAETYLYGRLISTVRTLDEVLRAL